MSTRSRNCDSNSNSNSRFRAYDFDNNDEQKNVEKHSLEILNKINSSVHSSPPIDKYLFLQHCMLSYIMFSQYSLSSFFFFRVIIFSFDFCLSNLRVLCIRGNSVEYTTRANTYLIWYHIPFFIFLVRNMKHKEISRDHDITSCFVRLSKVSVNLI